MSKSFIEFEKPRRTTEFVVIVKQIEAGQDCDFCQTLVGNGLCNMASDFQCAICNQWTCNQHTHTSKIFFTDSGSWSVCKSCGELSKDDQQRVFAFREALNQ